MSLSTLDDDDDDDVQGIDSLVLSLEEFSRTLDESSDVLSSIEPQLNGWIVDRTAAQNENKPFCRRSAPVVKDSKELRSSTPRRTVSRQFNRNREDLVEFKHFLQTGRYIEAYRNEKTSRQEAALKELTNKNGQTQSVR
ncbi:hypothetical protein OS493_005820 [Desmophyllum pertusum]|uniref:Uncharacterized protein n=1 Tax=Desmophyllum pertusum TaxID=174260 RepID=A0A9W9YFF3_9CNID|nr:hypothetical protein OS493_005820 [Desmophyllum pertusum]